MKENNKENNYQLAQTVRAYAEKQYNEASVTAKERVINAVRGHFRSIQRVFESEKVPPQNAFSRTFYLSNGMLGSMFKYHMRDKLIVELGFEKGDSTDPSKTKISIPEEQKDPFSYAHFLYQEHLFKMEEIEKKIKKEDKEFLQMKFPSAISFAQEFVRHFQEGSFTGKEISDTPGFLEVYVMLKLPDDLECLAYHKNDKDNKKAFDCFQRFILNLFEENGITEENGFPRINCGLNNGFKSNWWFRVEVKVKADGSEE